MLIRREDAALRVLRPFAMPDWASNGIGMRHEDEDRDVAGRAPALQPGSELGTEWARLQSRVETLEAALEEERTAQEAAVEAAFARGREAGERAADNLEAERLAMLRDQVAMASIACATQIDSKGDLAVQIARAAIHKILGEAAPRAALVEDIVRNAVTQAATGSVIAVRVSEKDFASDEELAALAGELGSVNIVRAASLPSGGCELELTMGSIDASLDLQIASLDRELARFGNGTAR
jgi:flagellar assembly protein FliH